MRAFRRSSRPRTPSLVAGLAAVLAAGMGLLPDAAALASAAPAGPARPVVPQRPAAPVRPAVPAHPALPAADSPGGEVSVTLGSTDGTAPLDTTNDPGYDASASNDIVRTNDILTYRVSFGAGAEPVSSGTVTMTLAAGVQVSALPAFCGPGSTLAPPAATSTAWDSAPTDFTPQVLTCALAGPFEANSTTNYAIAARVLPVFDNDDALVTSVVASGVVNGTTYTTGSETTSDTVSAAQKYDVQVMGSKGDPDTGGYIQYEGRYNACVMPGPTGGPTYNNVCVNMRMPVQIAVPDSGRGSVPLDPSQPVQFDLDLGLDAMFGAGATDHLLSRLSATHPTWTASDIARYYGARLNGCAQVNPYDAPRTALAGGTAQNSVRASGTTTCTVDGVAAQNNQDANGQVVTVTVTGMDSTAFTVPTLNGNGSDPARRRSGAAHERVRLLDGHEHHHPHRDPVRVGGVDR